MAKLNPTEEPNNRLLPPSMGESMMSMSRSATVAPTVSANEYVAIPLVVDVWMMRCLQCTSASSSKYACHQLYCQTGDFASGYVVWKILRHYFPRDIQMNVYRPPGTRHEYAEIWSHVDLVLQKHHLTRVPVDVIATVLEHRQAAQAILLMILYETLTNLKLPQPVPRLKMKSYKEDDRWRHLGVTKSSVRRQPTSFKSLLNRMFNNNQQIAFSKGHRDLQPPRCHHWHPKQSSSSLEKNPLRRLMQRPNGGRCHLFHADREAYQRQEGDLEAGLVRTEVAYLQQPFFDTDPMKKQQRAQVKKTWVISKI